MLDLFNIAKPQGCDIQTFYKDSTWVKPRGVSNVYMMLIGGGGTGNSGINGGGSGAVTTWYGAAQNVPDDLIVVVSTGNAVNTTVSYRGSSTTILLTAAAGNVSTAGAAMTDNQFTASGFFQSVAGQAGASSALAASATTFLSGGNRVTSVSSNYGYSSTTEGFFMLQPMIVGNGGRTGKGGLGCGGGASATNGPGGQGLVLIASW